MTLVAVVNVGLYGVAWGLLGHASPARLALVGGLTIALTCTNYQCVAHNFIHNPFFSSGRLRSLFAVMNSIALGLPQTLYRFHHLNHHRYNCDDRDLETGSTKDLSSIYRYSRVKGTAEHILAYAFLSAIRSDLGVYYGTAKARGLATQVRVEVGVVLAAILIAVALKPGFLLYVAPVWFLGLCVSDAQNYLEHHRAKPGNHLTDSVSCYGRLYNGIWFNNGYHQEHHYRPRVHWTKLPELRPQMLPDDQRRVVRFAHWFNL